MLACRHTRQRAVDIILEQTFLLLVELCQLRFLAGVALEECLQLLHQIHGLVWFIRAGTVNQRGRIGLMTLHEVRARGN